MTLGKFMSDEDHPNKLEKSKLQPVILIAEDNDDTRSIMRILLEARGYAVVEAASGKEAIEIGMREPLALILIDLSLPEAGGIAVIRRLRRHANIRRTPIIVVSGWDRQQYEETARNAGCNEYLSKPIDFDKFDAMLDRYAPLKMNPRVPKANAVHSNG